MTDMQRMEDQILLSIITRFLSSLARGEGPGTDAETIFTGKPIDWNLLIDLACYHRVDLIIYDYLKKKDDLKNTIPDKLIEGLKERYVGYSVRNAAMFCETERMIKLFNIAGIETLILKGAAIGKEYYPAPEFRPFGDIDLLVRPDCVDRAMEILIESGYTPPHAEMEKYCRRYWYDMRFCNDRLKMCLELHWHITQKKRYAIDMDAVWRNVKPLLIHRVEGLTMSIEYLILYLSVHMARHYFNRFLWMIDLACVIGKGKTDIDWDKIIEVSKEQRTQRPLYYSLYYVKELLGVDISEKHLARMKPNPLTDMFIKSILPMKGLPGNKMRENPYKRFSFSFFLSSCTREKLFFSADFFKKKYYRKRENRKTNIFSEPR